MPSKTRGEVAVRARSGALAALLGGLGWLQPAAAQDAEAVTVDVAQCLGLESDAARLACFGAQVDAVLQDGAPAEARESAAVTEDVANRAARSDERPSRPSERGARGARRGSTDEPRAEQAAEETREDEYSGMIVAIRERLPNAYVITLDNGQVWQQTEPKQYPLRPGLEVRIYPTGWGNQYRLNGLGTGSHIQVRRIQ